MRKFYLVKSVLNEQPILTTRFFGPDLDDFSQDREYDVAQSDGQFESDYPNADAFASALYDAFSKRFGMYYPNGVVTVDREHVHNYVHKFNSANAIRTILQTGSIFELTEAFCYGVFLASGTLWSFI
jgi:hypothetical protein